MSFSAAIFGALAAVVLLGERPRARRWTAIIIGFGGALIILRPGQEAMSAGALIILLSSLCWGTNIAIVKRLGRTDSTISIVTLMALMMTVMSLPPALWVWRWPSVTELGWLMLVGSLGSAGHIAMTQTP